MCIYFIVNTIGKLISISISTYGFCVFLHTRVAGGLKQLKLPLFIKSQEGSAVLSRSHALMLCTGSPVSASREQIDSATVQSRTNAWSSSSDSDMHIKGIHSQSHIPSAMLTVTNTWASTDEYLEKVWQAYITKYWFNHVALPIFYTHRAGRQKVKQESWAQKGNYWRI